MSDYPAVTTIIPTYRRPELLQRAIQSALNQTYSNLKVCVYDNASGDETAQVVAEIAKKDSRVEYHCHSKNIGAGDNFIFGMKNVDTEFFSFLSDDDFLLPNFYEVAMNGFDKFPDAMFSAASTIATTGSGEISDVSLLSWSREGYFSPPEGMFEMAQGCPAWTSILFRADTINEVGLLDLNLLGATDYGFQLEIAVRFPVVITKTPGAVFLNHEQSASKAANLDFFWPGWEKLDQKICTDERIPFHVRNQVSGLLAKHFRRILISIAINEMKHRNQEELIKISDVFRQYLKLPFGAFLVRVLAQLCRIPGSGQLVAWADSIRRLLSNTKRYRSRLNLEYGDYVKQM